MKLQLALDGNLEDSLAILEAAYPYIDIAEIGTPLVYSEGMRAVRTLREHFPDRLLLTDLKIMDAGEAEAAIAFEAGSDMVTVLGVSHDRTVQGALMAARHYGKAVMIDMLQVADYLNRARELLAMGCDYLCVHTAYDLQTAAHSPLGMLKNLRDEFSTAPLAVAGGIGLDTIDDVVALQPEIVVVGSAITKADNPALIAKTLHERMKNI